MTLAINRAAAPRTPQNVLATQVQSLVERMRPRVAAERRHDARTAIPILFELTPLDHNGTPLTKCRLTVVGKDISRSGISFYHTAAIPYRRAIVSLVHPQLGTFAAEIDIRWCRFTKPGWYESGGRMVRSIDAETVRTLAFGHDVRSAG